jgi:hypothetical protein
MRATANGTAQNIAARFLVHGCGRSAMKIIFAKPRHYYQSYVDFWRLVEASGFEWRPIDEIDLADEWACYIFTPMNGEVPYVLEGQPIRRARVIWWNLERPGQDPTTRESIEKLRGLIHAIWVSDRFVAQDPIYTYQFMASHEDIATRSTEREFDVCHLSYLWGRRRECIQEIARRGLTIAPEAYGRLVQDRIVARSRLMLNLHQYEDAPFAAPLRFAVAAAYAIPIISERLRVEQLGPKTQGTIDAIPDLVTEALLFERDKLDHYGFLLHHRFCVHTNFRHEVEKGVKALCG